MLDQLWRGIGSHFAQQAEQLGHYHLFFLSIRTFAPPAMGKVLMMAHQAIKGADHPLDLGQWRPSAAPHQKVCRPFDLFSQKALEIYPEHFLD